MEETRVNGEKTTDLPQVNDKFWVGSEFSTLVVKSNDCIASCKFNYHIINTTTAPGSCLETGMTKIPTININLYSVPRTFVIKIQKDLSTRAQTIVSTDWWPWQQTHDIIQPQHFCTLIKFELGLPCIYIYNDFFIGI